MLDTRRDRGEHRHQLGLEGLLQMVYAECQFVGAELLLLSEARDIGARYLVPNEVLGFLGSHQLVRPIEFPCRETLGNYRRCLD